MITSKTTLEELTDAAMTAVKLYKDLNNNPENKRYVDEVTDSSWTKYDIMVLLYMKSEADKQGIKVEELSDEFCNKIDDHIEYFRVLLKKFYENLS
ncbi:hypothetical protein [Thermosipho sp. (in: thermotogales)]|jgi:hypothetical protein|uniref:hypothetical protein n=1 Tax=Thermosipho sp. (in: thermotogales) TaxID=1968895 RepID=UPI00257CFBDA|nr:hypothetical protein [Thermosipho sp. (in: thermotogales)]MBZ4649149.1 hypothetical protein [Thermosipho sp. (in: thermotogales)]